MHDSVYACHVPWNTCTVYVGELGFAATIDFDGYTLDDIACI